MSATSAHRWCCTIRNMRPRSRWISRWWASLFSSLRAQARRVGKAKRAHHFAPCVTHGGRRKSALPYALLLLPHRVDTVGAAARACDVEARKAEHDREFAAVQKRDEAARKMRDEIGERHFTAQDEGHDPGAEAEDQKSAKHQFDAAGAPEQRP